MGTIDLRYKQKLTPTITAGAYSANSVIGGLLTFPNCLASTNPRGEVRAVHVYDNDKQGQDLKLYCFDSLPTVIADTADFNPSAADLAKICAIVPITTHIAFTTRGLSYANNQAISVWTLDTASGALTGVLYAYLVAIGTPTYASTSSLTIRPIIIQD